MQSIAGGLPQVCRVQRARLNPARAPGGAQRPRLYVAEVRACALSVVGMCSVSIVEFFPPSVASILSHSYMRPLLTVFENKPLVVCTCDSAQVVHDFAFRAVQDEGRLALHALGLQRKGKRSASIVGSGWRRSIWPSCSIWTPDGVSLHCS